MTSLPKNAGDPKANLVPAGRDEAHDDCGLAGYFGPCPPKGDKPHHYHFTVFAVDVDKLDADENASPRVRRLQPAFPYARQGDADRNLGPLTREPQRRRRQSS